MIKDQIKAVERSNDKEYNDVAYGLFGNTEFNEVVIDVMGIDFYGAIKSEMRFDPRGYLLNQLEMIVTEIDKKIEEIV